jgi:hypothetical protein
MRTLDNHLVDADRFDAAIKAAALAPSEVKPRLRAQLDNPSLQDALSPEGILKPFELAA